MRRSLLAMALAIALIGPASTAQLAEVAPKALRLVFPEEVDLTGLSIQYFLSGPFGGAGSFVRTRPDTRSYDLDAWHAGQAANTLKAIVYCPGRRFVLISQAGFGDGPARTLPVNLESLGSIPIEGRVRGSIAQPLQIEVTYLAAWSHSFHGIADGMIASFRVASAPLRADGTFSVRLPDFAADPVVAARGERDRGWFQFVAREPETGNIAYFLERSGQGPSGSSRELPVAASYRGELQFDIAK